MKLRLNLRLANRLELCHVNPHHYTIVILKCRYTAWLFDILTVSYCFYLEIAWPRHSCGGCGATNGIMWLAKKTQNDLEMLYCNSGLVKENENFTYVPVGRESRRKLIFQNP